MVPAYHSPSHSTCEDGEGSGGGGGRGGGGGPARDRRIGSRRWTGRLRKRGGAPPADACARAATPASDAPAATPSATRPARAALVMGRVAIAGAQVSRGARSRRRRPGVASTRQGVRLISREPPEIASREAPFITVRQCWPRRWCCSACCRSYQSTRRRAARGSRSAHAPRHALTSTSATSTTRAAPARWRVSRRAAHPHAPRPHARHASTRDASQTRARLLAHRHREPCAPHVTREPCTPRGPS